MTAALTANPTVTAAVIAVVFLAAALVAHKIGER